mmetsp:Transcript_4865/g.12153  ORF Transcript_4865/g.12153 Transcript_4865/m.12153 type:complete len:337 (-) Transcript_4865:1724-2734(-)
MRQRLQHGSGHLRVPGRGERLARLVEAVVLRQPLRVWEVHAVAQPRRGVPSHQREGVVPVSRADVHRQKPCVIAKLGVHLLGVRGVCASPACKMRSALAQRWRIPPCIKRAHHLHQLLLPPVLADDGDGLVEFLGLDVHCGCGLEVGHLLRPLCLPLDELLHDTAVAPLSRRVLLRPRLGLVELPQVREHLHSALHSVRLGVHLGRLLVLALVCEHLRLEHALGVAQAQSLLDAVEELDVAHVPDADEGLARHHQAHAVQRRHGQQSPVALRDSQARHCVRGVVLLVLQVAVEARRLWHVNGLHTDVVQAENFGALEAHHEPLQLLLVHRKIPCLD